MMMQSKHKNRANMDIISNLPDSILARILSLLPTKLAASTCVLSQKWQFLWIMIYNVDLYCNTARHYPASTPDSFANFVDKFFTLRDKNLYMKMFCLRFVSPCKSIYKRIDSWILAAISCPIEELHLALQLTVRFKLSLSALTCKTLVVLKLGSHIVIDAPPSSILFPSLKVLYLYDVATENQDSFGNLLSGCPVLVELVLKDVVFSKEFIIDYVISSPTLRFLYMNFFYSGKPIGLCLDAPALEYLELKLTALREIYLKNLDNLVEAAVDLRLDDDSFDNVRILHMVKDSLKALHNVQVLELNELFTMEAFRDVSFEDFPVFRNLVKLELDGCCCVWRMLLSLLQKLPYIQHLTVDHKRCYHLGSEAWVELDVPINFYHLRTFCFHMAFGNIDRSDDGMEFVTYVLKNCKGLENMTITCWQHFSLDKKHDIRQKLASLERGSKKCQLMFDGEVL